MRRVWYVDVAAWSHCSLVLGDKFTFLCLFGGDVFLLFHTG
jgi:hypothetical protein